MSYTKEEEQQYFWGLNKGYLIAQHEPQLAEIISGVEAANPDPRMEGLQDGIDLYERDKLQELRPDWLKDQPDNEPAEQEPSPDQDRKQDKGDDLEPDMD